MSEPLGLALTILALLGLAAVVTALCAGSELRWVAHLPLIAACGTSAVLAILLLVKVAGLDAPQIISPPVTWFAAGKLAVNFTINVDPLSCVMLANVVLCSSQQATLTTARW